MPLCRLTYCIQGIAPTAVAARASRAHGLRRTLSSASSVPSNSSSNSSSQPPHSLTAAFCVIGDEILNGRVLDVNSHFFAKRCFELGVEMEKIEIVPDKYSAIAASVQHLSSTHDIVFTSGGIGPTHDDITYSAIARAFGTELEYSTRTLHRMRDIMGNRGVVNLPDPHGSPEQIAGARMALFPKSATLTFPCDEFWVPVVCVARNIHVFPGIPKLFEKMVDAYLPTLVSTLSDKRIRAFNRALVGTWSRESVVAPVLTRLQGLYSQYGIRLGSYPTWVPEGRKTTDGGSKGLHRSMVVLSVVGKNKDQVEKCRLDLCKQLDGFDVPTT
ncbi:hypothetical protein LPJ74_000539 [Coemansia sp. RSA 1843]|nr:hypothetical protein LPJ74_000539 [Coemansia sp. RSA 1843]